MGIFLGENLDGAGCICWANDTKWCCIWLSASSCYLVANRTPSLGYVCWTVVPPQPMEIYVDDETKLTLHGLQQYYIKLAETEKNRKLNDLLDLLDFNQVLFLSVGNFCGDGQSLFFCFVSSTGLQGNEVTICSVCRYFPME